ncbi:unnamed protein product [Caenorhabditis bovis]|uniref:Uncharacterized protein n=1 Tax=Caenorhabditis bovis TaxID=2654633 RepID=A0A8S1EWG7_9PELO|nr:unnamed protein product [Caenorhabditis bovis]
MNTAVRRELAVRGEQATSHCITNLVNSIPSLKKSGITWKNSIEVNCLDNLIDVQQWKHYGTLQLPFGNAYVSLFQMGAPTGESNTEKRPQDAEVSDFPNDDNADFDVNVPSAANGGGTNPSEGASLSKMSSYGFWNCSALIKKCCFTNSGVLLSRPDCVANIRNVMKNKNNIDFYEILRLKSHESSKNELISSLLDIMAVKAFQEEEQRKPIVKSKSNEVAVVFDLSSANALQLSIQLPSRKQFKLAELVSMADCASWIAERDKYYVVYCLPSSLKNTKFAPIDEEVIENIAVIANKDKAEKLLKKLTKHRKAHIDDHQNTESPSNVSTFDDSISTVNERENFGSHNSLRL